MASSNTSPLKTKSLLISEQIAELLKTQNLLVAKGNCQQASQIDLQIDAFEKKLAAATRKETAEAEARLAASSIAGSSENSAELSFILQLLRTPDATTVCVGY